MPGPDPSGLDYNKAPDGRWRVTAEVWPQSGLFASNRKHRIARLRTVVRNLERGGWLCSWCLDPVPIWRRADARYCCQGCKRSATSERRAERIDFLGYLSEDPTESLPTCAKLGETDVG